VRGIMDWAREEDYGQLSLIGMKNGWVEKNSKSLLVESSLGGGGRKGEEHDGRKIRKLKDRGPPCLETRAQGAR